MYVSFSCLNEVRLRFVGSLQHAHCIELEQNERQGSLLEFTAPEKMSAVQQE